jgi:hypothetical protein
MIASICSLCAAITLSTVGPTADAITRTAGHRSMKITPGAVMITTVGVRATSACTANFVFRNATTTFLGYAAHCAIPAQPQRPVGCEYEVLPLGTPVSVRGADGTRAHGALAYSSWVTMRERGEDDDARCRFNDFALVAIDDADVGLLDPTVPGVGGPTELRTDPPERLARVVSYQPYNTRPAVKDGYTLGPRGGGWAHRVDVAPAPALGDSGSGLLDGDGAAFGVLVSRYLDQLATSGVTDLPHALAYANRYGAVGTVELVPGRRPFRAPRAVYGAMSSTVGK